MAECLQLLDGRGVIVAVVDRGIGGAIALDEFGIIDARTLVVLLLVLAGTGRRWRWSVAARGIGRCDQRHSDHRCRVHCQCQKPDRKFVHASLLMSVWAILY